MSSTRHADADTPFRQERYASSSVYQPGLLGNLVAKRCKAIRKSEDRALVYWLHAQSHMEGGLEAFAERFLATFASRIGTPTAVRLGRPAGATYTDAESAAIRQELPHARRILPTSDSFEEGYNDPAKNLRRVSLDFGVYNGWKDPCTGQRYSDKEVARMRADCEAAKQCGKAPADATLPRLTVDEIAERCVEMTRLLPEILRILCLDPEADLDPVPLILRRPGYNSGEKAETLRLWWFEGLIGALHAYRRQHIETARGSIAETTISRQIFAALDYAPQIPMREKLVLIEGDQRTGKTTAAEAWCAMHPGEAVCVRLESGRDIFTFYRCIARSIGTACSGKMKAVEMRMKIEDMLQERHLTVVIDEAHYLFPLVARPKSAPDRMDWVRTALVDHGVPVVLVATPQFDRQCALWQKAIGWNAAQIKGRVKLHEQLPTELPVEDLAAVALKMAPQADKASLLRLVGFAQSSDDYLAGIERLVCRATYFANQEGRDAADRADIKRALDEAAPHLEPAAPLPTSPKPKRGGSIRATTAGKGAKGFAETLPPALARRAGLDTSAVDQTAGTGASERLRFTEATASD